MLQIPQNTDHALETFRLDRPPREISSTPATAVKIADHPAKFLTYEGSVNKGQGTVKISDRGDYQTLTATADRRLVQLRGRILKGKFALTRITAQTYRFQAV